MELPKEHKGSKRIHSRRKALQDFYKLQNTEADGNEAEAKLHALADDTAFDEFLKNGLIQEILKLRGALSGEVNAIDIEKKSIIYDNYSELIKLGDILDDITKTKVQKVSYKPTNQSEGDLESVLQELSAFIQLDVSTLNADFMSILNEEDTASMEAITERENLNLDYPKLINEVNFLLRAKEIPASNKQKVLDDIQNILQIIDPHRYEYLILQFNAIRRDIHDNES